MRYRQLPLEQINVTDRNIRKTTSEEGMAELTASIDRFGVLTPILVFETGKDAYDLVAGHRRYAAADSLGLETIPAAITRSEEQTSILAQAHENLMQEGMNLSDELDVVSAAIQLTENAQREDVADAEEGEALLRIAGGRNGPGNPNLSNCSSRTIDRKTLAAIVGKSETWVQRRLSLILDLPDEVRARVKKQEPGTGENEGLALNTAAEIARLKDDPDVQVKLADKVEREGMTQPQTRRAVQKIKEDPESAGAVLAAKVDDSSFDAVTTRKADKTPAKQAPPPPSNAPDVMLKRFSQAYQNLCIALEPDRVAEVEAAGKNAIAEVRTEVAENACYMRALLDNFIHDWRLDELCGWTQEQAAEVASMGSGPRVMGLELISDEECAQ